MKLRQIETIAALVESANTQIEGARVSARRADLQARQSLERIEKREGNVARLIWGREQQLLRARNATATLDSLTHQRKLREAEIAAARSELAFLQAQLARTEGRVEFSEADRDTLMGDLDARLKALDAELGAGLAAADRARKSLAEA